MLVIWNQDQVAKLTPKFRRRSLRRIRWNCMYLVWGWVGQSFVDAEVHALMELFEDGCSFLAPLVRDNRVAIAVAEDYRSLCIAHEILDKECKRIKHIYICVIWMFFLPQGSCCEVEASMKEQRLQPTCESNAELNRETGHHPEKNLQ